MAEAAKDQDQSMEDILQSIKRIIAEEGEPAADAASSDVLELTDLLAEDGSVSQANAAPKVESISIEEIMAAPISSMPEKAPEPEVKMEPAPAQAPAPVVAPTPAPAPAPVAIAPEKPAVDEESLISKATLSASVSALNALRDSLTPAAPRTTDASFRSGFTIEDLVLEGLKPMLKDWLDQNLPSIVESLVEKEITKLSQH